MTVLVSKLQKINTLNFQLKKLSKIVLIVANLKLLQIISSKLRYVFMVNLFSWKQNKKMMFLKYFYLMNFRNIFLSVKILLIVLIINHKIKIVFENNK